MGVIDSLEQAEISDGGLIDFLHIVAFVLECIVANPVLYDRKNERYRDEPFKLKVWNEICTVFHDKGKRFLDHNRAIYKTIRIFYQYSEKKVHLVNKLPKKHIFQWKIYLQFRTTS